MPPTYTLNMPLFILCGNLCYFDIKPLPLLCVLLLLGAECRVRLHWKGRLQLRGGGRPSGPPGDRPRPHQPTTQVAVWGSWQLEKDWFLEAEDWIEQLQSYSLNWSGILHHRWASSAHSFSEGSSILFAELTKLNRRRLRWTEAAREWTTAERDRWDQGPGHMRDLTPRCSHHPDSLKSPAPDCSVG